MAATTIEIREREATERRLIGGLALMRLASPTTDELGPVTGWLLAALDDLAWLPPVGVVADVGHLVADCRSATVPSLAAVGSPRLRAALRAYEDEWLGRLAADARIDAARDAIARLPLELRARAVALVLGSVLERTGFVHGAAVNTGAARRLLARPATETLGRVQAAMQGADHAGNLIAIGYESLVHGARRARGLLDEADVFALENLRVLGSPAQRLAVAQIMDAAAEASRALPSRLKRRRQPAGHTPTRIEDESRYPAGGFAALSNAGSVENLVTSELVYMEDTAGVDIDLFDVRYDEGELLYYARDEAVLVRRRRAFVFLRDPSLATLRFKDSELRWQRLVALLGILVCLVRKLHEWLDGEDLSIRIVFLPDALGRAPLIVERGLVELLLRDWIEKGAVEVVEGALKEVAQAALLAARRAHVEVVLVGPAALGEAWSAATSSVGGVRFDAAALAPGWVSWIEALVAVVTAIV